MGLALLHFNKTKATILQGNEVDLTGWSAGSPQENGPAVGKKSLFGHTFRIHATLPGYASAFAS